MIYRRYVEAPRSHPRQGAPPRFRPTVGPTTPATAARAPTTRKPRSRRDRTRPSGGACRYAPPSASIRAACPLRRLARRVSSLRGTRALRRTSSLATRTAGLRPHVARPLIWRVENHCVIARFANPADLGRDEARSSRHRHAQMHLLGRRWRRKMRSWGSVAIVLAPRKRPEGRRATASRCRPNSANATLSG